MIKHMELAELNSCLNKAEDDEPIFVLRAKDPVAVATILHWCNLRVENGKNQPGDAKLAEAMRLCNQIAEWREAQLRANNQIILDEQKRGPQ